MALILMVVGLAGPVLAQPEDNSYCADLSLFCREVIPSLVYTDQPDSLLNLVYDWEDACGRAEPITRILLLAAIWDGAFSEDLYEGEIIEFLTSFSPTSDEDYDFFTSDLADQLLPHTANESLEQFFCLFYSGRASAAWGLLEGDALKGTYLKRMYDWELERLTIERDPVMLMVTAGYWRPEGNLALAGNHFFAGLMIEKRPGPFFGRLAGEFLIGRAKYPYAVNRRDITDRSNRFNALSLLAEGGYGFNNFDVFAGVGLEWLDPFREEGMPDDLALVNLKALLGVGYRVSLGAFSKYSVGVNVRREWVGDRNDGGTPLDGRAWVARLSFGYNSNHELDRRLHELSR